MRTYIREDDGAEMVEVKPHVFVSRRAAASLGLRLADAMPRPASGSTRGSRRAPSDKVPA